MNWTKNQDKCFLSIKRHAIKGPFSKTISKNTEGIYPYILWVKLVYTNLRSCYYPSLPPIICLWCASKIGYKSCVLNIVLASQIYELILLELSFFDNLNGKENFSVVSNIDHKKCDYLLKIKYVL